LPYNRNIQTLKIWEEQQDDSSQQVVRQFKDLEKRIRASNLPQKLKQSTPDSYFA
jgi:hypothetical protein